MGFLRLILSTHPVILSPTYPACNVSPAPTYNWQNSSWPGVPRQKQFCFHQGHSFSSNINLKDMCSDQKQIVQPNNSWMTQGTSQGFLSTSVWRCRPSLWNFAKLQTDSGPEILQWPSPPPPTQNADAAYFKDHTLQTQNQERWLLTALR